MVPNMNVFFYDLQTLLSEKGPKFLPWCQPIYTRINGNICALIWTIAEQMPLLDHDPLHSCAIFFRQRNEHVIS